MFDTLLLRPYVRPTDLFLHIECNECLTGFADARIKAERAARTRERPEVTLEEIYSLMDPEFKGLAAKEMEYERQVLQPNPEMKRMFDLAVSEGKRVIVLSDMYLPSSFIAGVLEENGFSGYERLYVSCEHRRSKHSGDMFELVLGDLGIPPGELLHIGDDRVSDDRTPSSIGIAVAPYEKVIDRYFRQHRRERRFHRRNGGLGGSVIVGMDALGWISGFHDTDYWRRFGYRYGGPVLSAFATFISRCATDKDGVVLFIARDGCGPRRAYNILYGNVENHYVYAPRTFNILFGINGKDYPGYEEQIVGHFSGTEEVRSLGPWDDAGAFLRDNRETFDRLMEAELEGYRGYLSGFTEGKDVVYVVDATTKKFSSQRLVGAASGKRSVGIYYTMLSKKDDMENRAFRGYRRVYLGLTRIDVPEFLMSSPEPPVAGLDRGGRPVLSEPSPEERARLDAIGPVAEGEDRYVGCLRSVFGGLVPPIDGAAAEAWVSSLTSDMTREDRGMLSGLHWASDPAHSRYHGLVFSPRDALGFMLEKIGGYYVGLRRRIG